MSGVRAYYNELDPYAAQWLRNLIAGGHIAPGDVDERSIVDVRPADLEGYAQCHFFAGVGIWSYALGRAGWADDRPVWTGSCPCQPFSAAGKGGGFDDERHLWPHFHWLISQCRPDVVLGEQVASKDGLAWLDLVQADLEGTGYASGAVDLCAAGVGAPHIRQRLWWVGERGVGQADAYDARLEGRFVQPERAGERFAGPGGVAGGVGDAHGLGQGAFGRVPAGEGAVGEGNVLPQGGGWPGPTNGLWGAADWLFCRDGKWRPVSAVAQQMVDGIAVGLGYLRADDRFAEEIGRAAETSEFANEVLRALRRGHGAEEIWLAAGRRIGFPQTAVLFAYLRKHTRELGSVADGQASRGAEEHETDLRSLRGETPQAACASQGWGLSEQCAGKLADALPVLPQAGAHALAELNGFPLVKGATGRVGRLRGYGNAIVAQAAQAFIESYLDIATIDGRAA